MTPQTRPPEVTHAAQPSGATGPQEPADVVDDEAAHPERRALAAALAVVTALILLVVVGAALAGDWGFDPGPAPTATVEPPPTHDPSPTSTPVVPDPPNETVQRTLTTVLLVAGGLVIAVLLYRVALWVRRTVLPWLAAHKDNPQPPQPAPSLTLEALPLTELREAATHAETLLHQGDSSPDAIIAAWLALQEAAERSGATRAPAQTPTEFTVEVLATTPASPAAVTELLGLFHLARFARADMTQAQVAAAGAALRQLIDDFSRPVEASPTSPTSPTTPTEPAP